MPAASFRNRRSGSAAASAVLSIRPKLAAGNNSRAEHMFDDAVGSSCIAVHAESLDVSEGSLSAKEQTVIYAFALGWPRTDLVRRVRRRVLSGSKRRVTCEHAWGRYFFVISAPRRLWVVFLIQ